MEKMNDYQTNNRINLKYLKWSIANMTQMPIVVSEIAEYLKINSIGQAKNIVRFYNWHKPFRCRKIEESLVISILEVYLRSNTAYAIDQNTLSYQELVCLWLKQNQITRNIFANITKDK